MPVSEGFIDLLKERLVGIGPLSVRRMFGGAGIYCEGVMFGLAVDDTLYLKVDGGNRPAVEARSPGPFSYAVKRGRNTITSFWQVPDGLIDEPDELLSWASAALAAAHRASRAKSSMGRARRQ
jgi:DNA transformation protein